MNSLLSALLDSRRLSCRLAAARRFWIDWIGLSATHPVSAKAEPDTVKPALQTGRAECLQVATSTLPSPRPLRMRTAPGDIRHAVISGPLGEVCTLLEQLACDQEHGDADSAIVLH